MNEKKKTNDELIEIYEIIGSRIARLRKANKMSQNDLSFLIGVSREHLAKVEKAKRGVSIKLLYNISKTFGISVFDFLCEKR